MAVIVDLNLVCIVCLQDEGVELVSVYSDVDTMDSEPKMTISEKISVCSNLNLADINIKISNQICLSCLDDLNVAWRFRKNCETSNNLFLSIQKQEDSVSLNNYEPKSQKSKPSGGKCHSGHADSNTYIKSSEEIKECDNINEIDGDKSRESFAGYGIVEYVDEDEDEDGQRDTVENTDYFECVRDEMLDEVGDDFEDINKSTKNDVNRKHNITIADKQHSIDVGCSEIQIKEEMFETIIEGDECEFPSEHLDDEISLNKAETESKENDMQEDVSEKENGKNLSLSNTAGDTIKPLLKTKSISNLIKGKTLSDIKSNGTTKLTSQKGKSYHGSAKICEICGNIYKYQHALNAHMRRHNNDRQFGCELCDKAFVSNVELRRHMRVHTGQKPYPCSFCDRRFSDFGSRMKHERTHTGERPYRCTTCNKSFAYPHVLTVHLRTHTGEKKFQCTRCGRGFTKKAYLLAHLENHARCENTMSLITRLNGDEAKGNSEENSDTTQQQEITAITTVAVEECIFTTDFINETDSISNNLTKMVVQQTGINQCIVEIEEAIDEEHLDEETNGSEYILGVQT